MSISTSLQVSAIVFGLSLTGPVGFAQSTPAVSKPAQFAISAPLSQTSDPNQSAAPARLLSNPAPQTTAGPNQLVPGVHFDGLGANGSTADGPSDSNIAVGPTEIVQMVNSEYAVYDKSGDIFPGYPKRSASIWAAIGGPCAADGGDPIVQYDRLADRWLLSQILGSAPGRQCIAISTTGDPTGSYALYSYDFGATYNDWPKFGVWPTATNSAYLATYNILSSATSASAGFCAYDRSAMLAGDPEATQICFTGSYPGIYQPSDLDGPTAPPEGSPAYFLGLGTNSLNVFKLIPDFANPSASILTGPIAVPVDPFSPACATTSFCVPQAGTDTLLWPLGDRPMYRLAYRNFGDHESMVVTHSIAVGSSVGIRWYELRNPGSVLSVFQQGTFAPDASFRWMGSIAMDRLGDLAMGYNISSSDIHPGIAYAGRTPAEPAGVMQPETILMAGGGSQTAPKWNDNNVTRIDPADDCTFWYTSQYLQADGLNWSTHIGSFSFTNCDGKAPSSRAPVLATLVNAASNLSGVSPGMIFRAYGTSIGPDQMTGSALDSNGHLSTFVAHTRILFDDVPAPILFVSSTQSVGIVPYEVQNHATAQAIVEYEGVQSAPFTVGVTLSAPGLFSANATGAGQGAINNQDGTPNSELNSATKGSIIVLWGTGEGVTNPPRTDGPIVTTAPYPSPTQPVSVNVSGKPAEILYAGSGPLELSGLFQVNVKLPNDIPSGNIPVILRVGSSQSQMNLTVAVQ